MALLWYTLVVDSHDMSAQARWWAETLDWKVGYEDDEEVVIAPHDATGDPVATLAEWRRRPQELVFVRVEETKTLKNRLHIDLAPHTSQDRDAEITALLERGATRVDVGQPDDVTWTVLADPEGNEFCVLSSRDR
ncbi:VOC family protein [Knoellia aerolata]|uniref:Glyoxalase n=1 Tax=Knoellia aerolata DSM 18566 TaxID=1385519 RepID=A0A0A0K3R3_9MICO|nr:VOC family protein [Knoellia aerolata]KGN42922.1 glyoxalase [Knoellia aerolata DSM 18566]